MVNITRSVFVYESRQRPYVSLTQSRLSGMGFKPILTDKLSPRAESLYLKFLRCYVHRSTNSEEFELQCFRRYFSLLDHVPRSGSIFLLDSDVLVIQDFNFLQGYVENAGDVDFICSIGVYEGMKEKQISPHFSLWNRATIEGFCDFLLEYYSREDATRALAAMRQQISSHQLNPSISDMTLLSAWVREQKLRFYDSNRVVEGFYLDHNITQAEATNISFIREFGVKKLIFPGRDRLVSSQGDEIQAIALHFPGRYKRLISPAMAGSRMSYMGYSALLALSRVMRL